ncbi:MAG: helix-turn-helix domain-containing protein, partial [Bosea sp.]|nr:helix-turn-helix domain-containing protein [Bosea sp. (in: a-proteobacteria)]
MSGPRFSIIPRDAILDDRLEGQDLRVLALLGSHTDNAGWCCRSQVKMARELKCARSTVQRALGRLIECGYLEQRAL